MRWCRYCAAERPANEERCAEHNRANLTAPRPANDAILLHVLESEVNRKVLHDALGRDMTYVASTGDKMYKRAEVVALGPGSRHPKTDARLPIPLEVRQQVVFRDWLTRWHTGSGHWPGEGDLALVRWATRRSDGRKPPPDEERAIVCVIERPEAWLDFARVHGAPAQSLASSGAAFETGALALDEGALS